jgi:hypothetical protein
MRVYENGNYRDMTTAEIAEMEAQAAETEYQYWHTISYDDAVDAEIRKMYSVSQEFAILRQREEKPDEYATYYAYCEECKNYVKSQMTENSEEMSE